MYCDTNENVGNIFTKPLGEAKFEFCRSQLCVVKKSRLDCKQQLRVVYGWN